MQAREVRPAVMVPHSKVSQTAERSGLMCQTVYIIMIYTGALSGQAPRPDINNGPGGDSNIAHVLVPGIYSNPTRLMTPPPAIPVLGQMEYTPVQVSHFWSGGCHI